MTSVDDIEFPWRSRQDRLFAPQRPGAPLPPLTTYDDVVAGIDVGGVLKGLHAVALSGGRVIATLKHGDHAEVAAWCRRLGAVAIGVDAPCRWGTRGARAAERALNARGVRIFPTPSYEIALRKPFFHWMLNGADLYRALAADYVLYDGARQAGGYCFETFPHAIACALSGRLLRAMDKRRDRRALLAAAGVDVTPLTNIDFIDAAMCAAAAAYVHAGAGAGYGERDDGMIFLPAAPLAVMSRAG